MPLDLEPIEEAHKLDLEPFDLQPAPEPTPQINPANQYTTGWGYSGMKSVDMGEPGAAFQPGDLARKIARASTEATLLGQFAKHYAVLEPSRQKVEEMTASTLTPGGAALAATGLVVPPLAAGLGAVASGPAIVQGYKEATDTSKSTAERLGGATEAALGVAGVALGALGMKEVIPETAAEVAKIKPAPVAEKPPVVEAPREAIPPEGVPAEPKTPAPEVASAPVAPENVPSTEAPSAAEPLQSFTESLAPVPTKSATVAEITERATEGQKLGVSALPAIGGTGLSKVGNAVKAALSEIRDSPKFTPFKEAVNRWFGTNQKTSLEVRQVMKEIESRVPTEARREAITNYLQADGDVNLLDQWARGTKNLKRKAAYDAAKSLTPDEVAVAQSIRKLYDDYLAKAQAYDLIDQGIEDYVTQVWKKPLLGSAQFAQFASKLASSFRFSKARTFENFFEGEQAGYKPVTKDISRLVGLYASEMGKTIATRDFIKDLTTKVADDGRPLAAPSGSGAVVQDANAQPTIFVRPSGQPAAMRDYSKWSHPALQDWKWVARDPISDSDVLFRGNLQLHPDIAGHVENVLSRSAIKRWYDKPSTALGIVPKALVKAIDNWGSLTKQVMLGFFAPFHHVQEATHAIGHRVNPLWDLPKLDPSNRSIQRAMNHGLALAGDNSAMQMFREGVGANPIFAKIPVVGAWANAWSDFLFHEYIPRLKLKTYEAILERNKARLGTTTSVDDIEYLSGQQANAAFGHLNYADIGRDPTIAHIARALLLAPDFLEARTRFTGQAMKGFLGASGREQLEAMATLAGTFFIGARIINKLLDDNYHWEEPFGVVHGNRTYTMRSVPEDIWRAFNDSRKFIYGRLSPIVGRGAIELLTGKNYRGEKTTHLETLQDMLASWIPITLRNLPGFDKLSPSQANRTVSAYESFLGALGLQISRHSPINRTYQLAHDYMRAQGEKEDRGSYPISKYQQLRYALEDADIERAAAEIQRLRTEENLVGGKLAKGFHESLFHPWTKGKAMDHKFRDSLSKDDRMLFDEAENQRRRVWSRFNQAVGQARQNTTTQP